VRDNNLSTIIKSFIQLHEDNGGCSTENGEQVFRVRWWFCGRLAPGLNLHSGDSLSLEFSNRFWIQIFPKKSVNLFVDALQIVQIYIEKPIKITDDHK
jgi:hypothetical protein